MASRAGARFHAIPIDQNKLAENFADATLQSEMLCVNAHGVAKFLLSKAVRDAGYKVVITGEGSDEILGGYAHFRRGGWQYDPGTPDWPGSWTNHRHAWEGSACKLYKVINPAQGTVEAMGDDKAICVFAGQAVTDPHANPGVPTADPSVMLWPYDNENAAWDPELTRPTGVECTQNAQCASGTCEAGSCR